MKTALAALTMLSLLAGPAALARDGGGRGGVAFHRAVGERRAPDREGFRRDRDDRRGDRDDRFRDRDDRWRDRDGGRRYWDGFRWRVGYYGARWFPGSFVAFSYGGPVPGYGPTVYLNGMACTEFQDASGRYLASCPDGQVYLFQP